MNDLKETLIFDLMTQQNVNAWLEGQYDEMTKSQIRQLLEDNPQQIIDSFYTTLAFGTGGLRGLVGLGSNRMNFYTVRAATQGLANYIQKQPKKSSLPAVLIGYDSRHFSREFAEETAKVLAGNQIQVYLFKDLRPTPLVSFGCRYKNCIAAIMITASHNPAAYNGYKVFWSDGGQVISPHDQGIIDEVNLITNPSLVKMSDSFIHPFIEQIETDIDQAYLNCIQTLQHYPQDNKEKGQQLKIIYTSLHGTGITLVPKALETWGFSSIKYVESQIIPDGSFPTVPSPNPEESVALKKGIDLMLETEGDVLIATDPDADRMGIAVRHHGKSVLLNGNQISAICLDHICKALSSQHRLSPSAAFIKTIGTTELFQAICDHYQRPCFNVLTGFKYIAAKIHQWEQEESLYEYVFGGEESYGYLLGSFARDKDAVISSSLIAEVALQAKLEGKTLIDRLYDLYQHYGVYQEALLSLNFGETKEGKEQMRLGMQLLRESKLESIHHVRVIAVEDYSISTKFYIGTNKTEPLTLPISDVLLYWLEDGSKVMIRPSGTEPKVKLYCGVVQKSFQTIEEGITICLKRCEDLLFFLKNQLLN